MLGFAERDVAVVLDDQSVDAAVLIAPGFVGGEVDDLGDRAAVIGRAAGQGQGMDHSDDDLAASEDGFQGVGLGLEDRVRHRHGGYVDRVALQSGSHASEQIDAVQHNP